MTTTTITHNNVVDNPPMPPPPIIPVPLPPLPPPQLSAIDTNTGIQYRTIQYHTVPYRPYICDLTLFFILHCTHKQPNYYTDQRGLLENIWSFVKTDVNNRRFSKYVLYTSSCLFATEGVWVEALAEEGKGSLSNMLMMNCGTPSNDEDKTEMEQRQRFHNHWNKGCWCGKCGGLPGDTITYDDFEYRVERMEPATKQELCERGYFGNAAVPTRFWE